MAESLENKSIIILDIDGVLCYRKYQKGLEEVQLSVENSAFKKKIYLRKGINEFLDYIFKNDKFKVAVFSSTTEKNADPIIKHILKEEQYNKLLFKWFRDRTRNDENYEKIYDTVKVLQDIIENPTINENRKIKLEHLLMLDDSERKMGLNKKENYIIINSDPEYDMRDLIKELENRAL